MARLIRDGNKVYFRAADGVMWRVYDVAFGPPHSPAHRRLVVPFESPKANYRWFVAKDGTQRCHLFEKGESRELTVEVVAYHLHRAGYVALVKFDPTTRNMPR